MYVFGEHCQVAPWMLKQFELCKIQDAAWSAEKGAFLETDPAMLIAGVKQICQKGLWNKTTQTKIYKHPFLFMLFYPSLSNPVSIAGAHHFLGALSWCLPWLSSFGKFIFFQRIQVTMLTPSPPLNRPNLRASPSNLESKTIVEISCICLFGYRYMYIHTYIYIYMYYVLSKEV